MTEGEFFGCLFDGLSGLVFVGGLALWEHG